ncbi:EF-Tu/IF-2/RF-3 family GTPase, partial [Staphylococcus aureus]
SGSYVKHSTNGQRERVGRLLPMHANSRQEIDTVYSGDIAAAVGLKDPGTGDTFCGEKNDIILESLEFPEPVIHLSVEPTSKAAQDKLTQALVTL